MSDVSSIISQLEQQKASIDRAIDALREITASGVAADPAATPAISSDNDSQAGHITPGGRRKLAEAMKRRWAAKRAAAKKAKQSADSSVSAKSGTPAKRRTMTADQKRAISKAWTPERKQKFAEFHVQRMARERGEDPARALRQYRRRKQMQQAGTPAAAKNTRRAGTHPTTPRKAAAKKRATKKSTAPPPAAVT